LSRPWLLQDPLGLKLCGFEVDAAFCSELKQGLRVLHMERGMQPSPLFFQKSAGIEWLGVCATTSQELHLGLRALPLVTTILCPFAPHNCTIAH
jgi:hypothetical protein